MLASPPSMSGSICNNFVLEKSKITEMERRYTMVVPKSGSIKIRIPGTAVTNKK